MTYIQENLEGGNKIKVSAYLVNFTSQSLAYENINDWLSLYNSSNSSDPNHAIIQDIIKNKTLELDSSVINLHTSSNHTTTPTVSNNEIILPAGNYLLQGCPSFNNRFFNIGNAGFTVSYSFKTGSNLVGLRGITHVHQEVFNDTNYAYPWSDGVQKYFVGQNYAKLYASVTTGTQSYSISTDDYYSGNSFKNPFVDININEHYPNISYASTYGSSNYEQNFGNVGRILIFKL